MSNYFEELEKRLEEKYPNGAVPRLDSQIWLNLTPGYMSKLDCLKKGPEKIKLRKKVHYPIKPLIRWLQERN